MTREQFETMTPENCFLLLTNEIYQARRSGNWQKIDCILSVFDDDARRLLCVGSSCLMAMGDNDFSDALKTAMSSELYEYFNREGKTK